MPGATFGVINDPKARSPKPKPSPKSFQWPNPDTATDEQRQTFAASLQELLPLKNWGHLKLCAALWGVDAHGAERNNGKTRDWVRGTGRFPNEKEAGYVAQLLSVPMERLMNPKAKFDPNTSMVRAPRAYGPRKNGAAKANGHDTDTRWTLPEGVDPPSVKLETSKKHPSLMVLELKGEMPSDIAMAIMALAAAKRAD